jgi:hypothetical protein
MVNQTMRIQISKQQISLPQLIELLTNNRQNIILNFQHLQENYQHQHSQKVPGTRDLDSNLIEPWLRTQDINQNEYVQISSFTFNRHNASLNMLIQRQIKLVKVADTMPIVEVAGLLTNHLNRFNSYTIVSDGKINIREIRIKISSHKTFSLLYHAGVITSSEFDFRQEHIIHIDQFPLVDPNQEYESIDGIFPQLAETTILMKIISAHLRKESDRFSPEQLETLSQHHLSKNVYINLPRINQCSENIKPKIIHQIDIGNKQILNLNQLHSANKFLNRIYRAYDLETGEILPKSNLGMAMLTNIAFRHKLISSRMKITVIDEFMQPIFDDFLGLADNGKVATILDRVGANFLIQLLQEKRHGKHVNKSEMVTALTAANTKLGQYIESIYRVQISPLIFYIGSTGLLPKNIQALAMNAQEIALNYPKLQFSLPEKSGKFFVIGDSIISIYSSTSK